MKKEYRNKLIATVILLICVFAIVILDAYFNYEPETTDTGVVYQVDVENV